MTNVRGVSYPLYADAALTLEEYTAYYGDKLRFEVVPAGAIPAAQTAKPLPIDGSPGTWPLLKEAAKATGAFPIFLAPRKLPRDLSDYAYPPWDPLCSPTPSVRLPSDLSPAPPPVWETLNIDGGVTDNDPFQLAQLDPLNQRDRDTEGQGVFGPPHRYQTGTRTVTSVTAECRTAKIKCLEPSILALDRRARLPHNVDVGSERPKSESDEYKQDRHRVLMVTSYTAARIFNRNILSSPGLARIVTRIHSRA